MSNEIAPGTTERKALIVGCGISGPVLAMFLKRAGIYPVIYEGRPEPKDEAGFFLNLAPNGTGVLDALGIKDEVLGHGIPTTSIVFQNHCGKKPGVLPETTVIIKRGLLNKALRETAIRSGVPDVEGAFAAFEALRKDRVEELVEEARRNGSRKGPTNVLTRGLRDLVLPFFLKMGVKNAERVYSYRVDWYEKVA